MGTLVTYNNVDASATGGLYFLPPVPTGLTGWFDIFTDAPTSSKNRAKGGAAGGSVIGAPTYAPGYASFAGLSAFIQTGVAETASFTWMFGFRSSAALAAAASEPCMMSTFLTTAGGGVSAYVSGTTGSPAGTLAVTVGYTNAGVATSLNRTLVLANIQKWNLICVTFDATTGTVTINNLTDGTTSTITNATAVARLLSTSPLRVGSGYVTEAGPCDMTIAATWGLVLTGAQQATMYAFLKNYLSVKKGVTV